LLNQGEAHDHILFSKVAHFDGADRAEEIVSNPFLGELRLLTKEPQLLW